MSHLKRQRGPSDGGELTASALGNASSAGPGTSAVAQGKIERLEVLLRQTELLRRLDCDSHAAEKAQMGSEIANLSSQVESLTAALQGLSRSREAALGSGGSGAPPAAAQGHPGAAGEVASLRAQLSSALSERDEALAALAHQRSTATAALSAGRDAVARAEAAAAEAGRQVVEARAEVRALKAAAARESSGGWVSAGGNENSASVAALVGEGALTAGQAAALREEARAARERCRLMEAQVERAAARRQNEVILVAQGEAAAERASRAEGAAGHAASLALRVRLLLEALGEWDRGVWAPLFGGAGAQEGGQEWGQQPPAAPPTPTLLPPDHPSVGQTAVAQALAQARQRLAAVAASVSRLQASHANAVGQLGEAQARLGALGEARRVEADGAQALRAALTEATRAAAEEGGQRAAAEARLAASQAHAQRLKAVCETYEKEYTAALGAAGVADNAGRTEAAAAKVAGMVEALRGAGGQGGSGGGGSGGGGRASAAAAALTEATGALQEAWRATRAAAETMRSSAAEFSRVETARLRTLEGQVSAAEDRLACITAVGAQAVPRRVADVAAAEAKTAQAHVAALQAEVCALWEKFERGGGGKSGPPQQQQQQREGGGEGEGEGAPAQPPTRILHLSINPTSQAFKFWDDKQRALMAALREEVETCRAALASANASGQGSGSGGAGGSQDAGGGGAQSSTINTSSSSSSSSSSVLIAEKEDAKKIQQRTVEIFRERVSRMRDICNRLLGWKMELDFVGAGADQVINIKLSSLYAASPAAQFILKFELARGEFTVLQYAEGTDSKNFAYVQVSK
jgi:hypothetical protein